MTFSLLCALLMLAPGPAPAASALSLRVDATSDSDAHNSLSVVSAEGAQADGEVEQEQSDAEPFPWDTVSGLTMGLGGFLTAVGVTTAGTGVLFLTAPGTLTSYNVAAFALIGVGSLAGLVGAGTTGAGGLVSWLTAEEDED